METLKRKLAERENKISNFNTKATEAGARADKAKSDLDEAIKAHSEDVERLTRSYEAEREKLVMSTAV